MQRVQYTSSSAKMYGSSHPVGGVTSVERRSG